MLLIFLQRLTSSIAGRQFPLMDVRRDLRAVQNAGFGVLDGTAGEKAAQDLLHTRHQCITENIISS